MTTIDEYSLATLPLGQYYGDTHLGFATGFIWERRNIQYLITNWHVVAGRNAETGATLHPQGGRPDRLIVAFNPPTLSFGKVLRTLPLFYEGEPIWLIHSVHGRAVDLAAIPLDKQPADVSYRPINLMSSMDLQISIGMDVFILGYPFGLQQPGFPVWKRGSIASEPDLAHFDRHFMLVDSASRPGMSGAPVIRRSWGNHLLENNSVTMGPGSGTRFIGVYSGRLHTNDPNDPQLARVWPLSLIDEIIDVPTPDKLDEA